MTSQLSCPNSACGRVLMVKAEYAGRTVKCPACGTSMAVPALTGAAAAERTDTSPRPVREGGNGAQTNPVTFSESRPGSSPALVAETVPAPIAGGRRSSGITIAMAFGAFSVAVVGFSPYLSWLTSGPGNTHLNNRLVLYAANVFPGVGTVLPQSSLVVAAVVLIALILGQSRDREMAEGALAAASAAAFAWASCSLLWTGGYVWKILNWPVRDIRDSVSGQIVRLQCLPGMGLWIAVGGAGIALVLFAFILVQRRRKAWLLTALLMGLALGAAFLYLVVRPWEIHEMQFLPG
jgi:hypothetical protein